MKPNKEKHCGFCHHFDHEYMHGYGICDKYDTLVYCGWKGKDESAKSCEEWVERKDKFYNAGQVT